MSRSGTVGARTCIAIRTHRWGEAEEGLHAELLRCFRAEDVFAVVDQTGGEVPVPASVQKLSFDRARLDAMGLHAGGEQIGWRCGDYFHYVLRQDVGADFAWLVEPDLRFTFADPGEFFAPYAADETDLLLLLFGARGSSWMWHAPARRIAEAVHGCAFPISRLSGTAADRLLEARRRLSATWAAQPVAEGFPNDESFVATQGVALGLRCGALEAAHPGLLSHFSVYFPYLWPDAERELPRNRIVHPAVGAADFPRASAKYLDALFQRVPELQRFLQAATTGADAGHIREVRRAFQERARLWAAKTTQRNLAAANAREGAGAGEGAVRIAPVTGRTKQNVAVAAATDFETGGFETAATIDTRAFTPYCFDYDGDAFVFVDTPAQALDEAFFYQAQFRHATRLATVPRKRFVSQMRGRVPAPTLVFSIGRCGSTLFSRLAGACGVTSFSEPDIFTGINPHAAEPRADGILRGAALALADFAGVEPARTCIKLRSASNGVIARFLDAFPDARIVFMVRGLADWAASFVSTFGWSDEQLAHTLHGACRALGELERRQRPFSLLRYEDMVSDPAVVHRILCGAEPSAAVLAALREAAASDSQRGAGLRPGRLAPEALAARVDGFLRRWQGSASEAELARFPVQARSAPVAGAVTPAAPRPFVFVHINKTGGSSIEHALGLPLDHSTAREWRKRLGPEEWERRYRFAVVRNPWDKVVSHYFYRIATNQNGMGQDAPEFGEWVRLAYAGHDPRYFDKPRMFMPQVAWISDESGRLMVHRVCRFETLAADFAEVCRELGIVAELPHAKASARPAEGYRDYYDARSRETIRRLFRKDLDAFGYEF